MARTFQLVSVFSSLTVWENLVLSGIRFRTENTRPWRFLLASAKDKRITNICMESLKLVGLENNALTRNLRAVLRLQANA